MSGERAAAFKREGLRVFMRTALAASLSLVKSLCLLNRFAIATTRQRKLTARASTREARRLCWPLLFFALLPVAACMRKHGSIRGNQRIRRERRTGCYRLVTHVCGSGRVGPSFLETFCGDIMGRCGHGFHTGSR